MVNVQHIYTQLDREASVHPKFMRTETSLILKTSLLGSVRKSEQVLEQHLSTVITAREKAVFPKV